MKTKGIRILDKTNRTVCVKLQDILEEISNGNSFYWSILSFYGSGHLANKKSIPEFEKEVDKSENGFLINWNDLTTLARDLWEVEDILLIGSTKIDAIQRYKNDQEMYESCDIVIEMFDSCFWEVFSNDEQLINKLLLKFKKIEFLDSDFKK